MPAQGTDLIPLPGSDRAALPGSRRAGPCDAREIVEVSIVLRRRSALPTLGRPADGPRPIPRAEFAARFGARDEDREAVRAFAARAGLRVVADSAARRTVRLAGPSRDVATAFGTELHRYLFAGGSYRGRVGAIRMPPTLVGPVLGVLGLDNRPQARPPLRHRPARAADAPSYTAPEIAAAYDFPTTGGGAGQSIGVVELGGGYRAADLATYFAGIGLGVPSVRAVGVDGASNQSTGSANGPDAEVELDLEVAGSVAPAAAFSAYFAPNTDAGFLDAVTTAVHDATDPLTALSISWGGPEESWTAQARAAFASAFEDAAALGVTVLASAGDQGASDGSANGALEVDFPASDPGVIGCGGTTLVLADGAIASETTWNELARGEGATGGGVSQYFARPTFQASAHVPTAPNGFVGRGVPDVAGDADPVTGYRVEVDGAVTVLGGTSAVAPLWAGLIALLNEALGAPLGLALPRLYAAAPAGFHDIVTGGNGGYDAGPGWDPCTGLGSPDGARLLGALGGG